MEVPCMHVFNFQKLDVYVVAKNFAREVVAAGIGDPTLRAQATEAAKSTFLNIAEGLPDRRPGIRDRHFNIARNSLGEAVAGIDLAEATGALSAAKAETLMAVAAKLHCLVCGLLKR